MKIDLDFDLDYLRIYFRLEHYIMGCLLDDPDDYGDAFCLEFDFSITNNSYWSSKLKTLGFYFHNEYQIMTISILKEQYEFDIPYYLFVSKTKEYVDHFNWIKEAYVR